MYFLEYQVFNDLVFGKGYEVLVEKVLGVIWYLLVGGCKYLSVEEQLVVIVGLEYIIVIFVDIILWCGDMVEKMDLFVCDLWVWYFIEEIEYKVVVFDFYQDVDGGYWCCQCIFFIGIVYLIGFSVYFIWQFFKQDGVNWQLLILVKGLWKMFGYWGVVSVVILVWFQYLCLDFYFWQDDNIYLLDVWCVILFELVVFVVV